LAVTIESVTIRNICDQSVTKPVLQKKPKKNRELGRTEKQLKKNILDTHKSNARLMSHTHELET